MNFQGKIPHSVDRISLFILLALPFYLLSVDASAQKTPQNPKNPSLPKEPLYDVERDSRGEPVNAPETYSETDKENDPNSITRSLRITLCDGRQVTGKWEGKLSKISFHHIKEGIRYQKTLPLKEISGLKILDWRAELQKKEQNGTAYKMLPNRVQLDTLSGESFKKDSGLEGTEFSFIKLENPNGVATLYSMWIDLLYKDGNWYSKLKSISPKENRTDCHPDVIRQIKIIH